ncbi:MULTISPECIES: AbrB/MazE/SpoVT family DNA-binding domain-containing protein [Kyrpidia]|uniref:Transcriptional regulator, AbrB family n=2 Tax=Kyrpidia TaxID=1129704 RepID=A0A6F9EIE5_9BACL|nr:MULTISPECIES: AbrB/MazE/SpoVT family DNA-binding domain-containing protein [Kyrpidia]ADG07664.1 transcriptional regulator, AbrB family [Kyrpidia tusciae DSM 2912]CAB3396064.1 Transcriptional regulator, AbrB family [Kyrpidia spormannii]HHY67022.1 AbrB/MazE/SpoVT family DNA-binding domain-containing protein [Alicyclobacillus sp.]
MAKARLGKRSQIVLPKPIVEALQLEEGTEFEITVVDGRIVMEPLVSVPRSQAWFWTEKWQREEREAEEDVRAGRLTTIRNTDDLDSYFAQLDADRE